jgi:hypothetical protein
MIPQAFQSSHHREERKKLQRRRQGGLVVLRHHHNHHHWLLNLHPQLDLASHQGYLRARQNHKQLLLLSQKRHLNLGKYHPGHQGTRKPKHRRSSDLITKTSPKTLDQHCPPGQQSQAIHSRETNHPLCRLLLDLQSLRLKLSRRRPLPQLRQYMDV